MSQPAMKVPTGEIANFDHPPSIQPEMVGLVTSMFLLATLAVGVRYVSPDGLQSAEAD